MSPAIVAGPRAGPGVPPEAGPDDTGFTSLFCRAPDGLRLHARDYGAGRRTAGLPVVCLPGLARNAADFHELALTLSAESRRVLALDYRGRGLSERDPDPSNYDVRVEANDVLGQLTVAGIDEAVIVGTSRGGLIAMALSAIRPALLRGVVLNDVGPVIEVRGLIRIRNYVGKLPSPRTLREAADLLRHTSGAQFPILGDEEWARLARRTWREEGGRLVPRYDPALTRGLDALDLEAPLPNLWPLFVGLTPFPVLAIRGANSDLLSAETLDAMRARHPRLTSLTVPGQGHAPLLSDRPTLEAVTAFVRRAEGEPRSAGAAA